MTRIDISRGTATSRAKAATLPVLSEEQIRARVGDASFQRGRPYASDGSVFDTRLQGRTLKAHCYGSHGETYRLWITFGAENLEAASCSCPVGGGGYCKHIAAL